MHIPNDSDVPSRALTSPDIVVRLEHILQTPVLQGSDKGFKGNCSEPYVRPRITTEAVKLAKRKFFSFLEENNPAYWSFIDCPVQINLTTNYDPHLTSCFLSLTISFI